MRANGRRLRPAWWAVCLMALGAVVPASRPAEATVVVELPERELTASAAAIVVGRVKAIASDWDASGRQIFTDVTVALDEVVRGELPPASDITIRQLGGRVGDTESRVLGSPQFAVGERVLLFLRPNPDGSLRVAHLYLGKYSVTTDAATGEAIVRRRRPAGVLVLPGPGADELPPALEELQRLRDLLDRVRAHLRQLPRPRGGTLLPLLRPRVGAATTGTSSQFTFLGTPSRWFEPDTGGAISMRLNSEGEPAAPSRGFDQLVAAYGAWSSVTGSAFRYVDGGLTTAVGYRRDGVNAISFRDPLDQMDSPSGCRGVLAIGGYFSSTSQRRTVNGQTFNRIVEGDVVINNGWQGCGFYENFANLAEVATHELGHVLGLGHSPDAGATMYAGAHFDGRGAALTDDDAAGLRFIYPAAAGSDDGVSGDSGGSSGSRPDLVVEQLAVSPGPVAPGASATVTYRVANRGTAAATATYAERLYLSSNTTLDGTDVLLATTAGHTADLAPGATLAVSQAVSIPAGTTAGTYYLLVQADAGSAVVESNEGNNAAALLLSVSQPAASAVTVDNAAPGARDAARTFTGTWCASGASRAYSGGSLQSCGGGRDTYRWTPRLEAGGTYDVYVWWTSAATRSRRVPIAVRHANGTTTKTFDQRTGGGQWRLHGRYRFNAGTGGHVQVSDANGQAAADAVRFVPVP